MIFNTANPGLINQRQKQLAQRLVQKQQAHTMELRHRPNMMRPIPGRGGGAGAGVPFKGIGPGLKGRAVPSIAGLFGGIPQSIIDRMGIGGRGIAGRDFNLPGTTPYGAGPSGGPGMGMPSQNAPDYYGAGDPIGSSAAPAPAPGHETPGTMANGQPVDYLSALNQQQQAIANPDGTYNSDPTQVGINSYGGWTINPDGTYQSQSDVPQQDLLSQLIYGSARRPGRQDPGSF